MPTTLKQLQAEKEAQDEEEARPPITDVESGRSFITNTTPEAMVNVTLEMCVLRIEDGDKNYRLELIDRDLESQFDKMKKTLDSLDAARRSKFVLLLTMWKSRKPELNHIEFREGLSYRFEKVHSLRLMYGNPTGSIQIRGRLRAVPLVITGDDTSNKEDGPQTTSYNNPTGDGMPSMGAINSNSFVSLTPPRYSSGMSVLTTPVVKSPAKRKTHKSEENEQAPKRSRKDNEKVVE